MSISSTSDAPRNAPHPCVVLFQCEGDWTPDHAEFRQRVSHGKSIIENYSGYDAVFLKVRDDPTRAAIISGWDSVEQHYKDFHHSEHIYTLMSEFGGVVDITSSWHTDMPYMRLLKQLSASTISLIRCHVLVSEKSAFESHIPAWKQLIEKIIGRHVFAGWRCNGGWGDQGPRHDYLEEYAPETRKKYHDDEELREDTVEWDIIFLWKNWQEHDEVVGNKEKMKAFYELFKFVVRMELLWLEPTELPEWEPSDGESEESEDSEESEEYHHSNDEDS